MADTRRMLAFGAQQFVTIVELTELRFAVRTLRTTSGQQYMPIEQCSERGEMRIAQLAGQRKLADHIG